MDLFGWCQTARQEALYQSQTNQLQCRSIHGFTVRHRKMDADPTFASIPPNPKCAAHRPVSPCSDTVWCLPSANVAVDGRPSARSPKGGGSVPGGVPWLRGAAGLFTEYFKLSLRPMTDDRERPNRPEMRTRSVAFEKAEWGVPWKI